MLAPKAMIVGVSFQPHSHATQRRVPHCVSDVAAAEFHGHACLIARRLVSSLDSIGYLQLYAEGMQGHHLQCCKGCAENWGCTQYYHGCCRWGFLHCTQHLGTTVAARHRSKSEAVMGRPASSPTCLVLGFPESILVRCLPGTTKLHISCMGGKAQLHVAAS